MKLLWLVASILGLTSCALLAPAPPTYDPVVLPSGVWLQDLMVPPQGPLARDGDVVLLHFEFELADGTLVDSSFDRGQPVEFVLGAGELPPGLEESVLGMRAYGRRRAIIPSHLAFGAEGRAPRIPPDAELHCVLELMGLQLSP